MIAAFILYSVLLGVLVAAAAWLTESALAANGKARRHAWIAGIAIALGLPLGMALFNPAEPAATYSIGTARWSSAQPFPGRSRLSYRRSQRRALRPPRATAW